MKRTGYPCANWARRSAKIQAKDKILLTDSCHSGAIRPEDLQDINA